MLNAVMKEVGGADVFIFHRGGGGTTSPRVPPTRRSRKPRTGWTPTWSVPRTSQPPPLRPRVLRARWSGSLPRRSRSSRTREPSSSEEPGHDRRQRGGRRQRLECEDNLFIVLTGNFREARLGGAQKIVLADRPVGLIVEALPKSAPRVLSAAPSRPGVMASDYSRPLSVSRCGSSIRPSAPNFLPQYAVPRIRGLIFARASTSHSRWSSGRPSCCRPVWPFTWRIRSGGGHPAAVGFWP